MTPTAAVQRLILGCDLDGVLYDFLRAFRTVAAARGLNFDAHAAPTVFEFHHGWGLDDDTFAELCTYGVERQILFADGAPPPGVAQATHELLDAGHQLHLITARSCRWGGSLSRDLTRQWLTTHDIAYTSLTFAEDKTVVPTQAFLEDHTGNYDALERAGTRAYLLDQPWNQDQRGQSRRRRVISFPEYLRAAHAELAAAP